jgi:predicted nucleotidyltransferase component of viral defense system
MPRVVAMFEEANVKRFVAELHRLTGLPDNLIEQDVWQKLVLNRLYADEDAGRMLVFKGGTCITRTLLGYYRFSEDLDFSWKSREPKDFYKKFELERLAPLSESGVMPGKHYGTLGGRLMKWDLACGSGKLVLSVNFSSGPAFPIERRPVFSLETSERRKLSALFSGLCDAYYAELSVPCYSAEEIICEKIAAVFTRRDLAKPRDIVDLFYLGRKSDLRAICAERKAVLKIGAMVRSTPAYTRIFEQRRKNIAVYLSQLAAEAFLERIYISPPKKDEFDRFFSSVLIPLFEGFAAELR